MRESGAAGVGQGRVAAACDDAQRVNELSRTLGIAGCEEVTENGSLDLALELVHQPGCPFSLSHRSGLLVCALIGLAVLTFIVLGVERTRFEGAGAQWESSDPSRAGVRGLGARRRRSGSSEDSQKVRCQLKLPVSLPGSRWTGGGPARANRRGRVEWLTRRTEALMDLACRGEGSTEATDARGRHSRGGPPC